MAIIGGFHLLVLFTMPVDTILTNKIVGATMQIVGGLIVIYSVDSNLGLFRQQTILGGILAWLRECPLRPRRAVSVTINASTGCATMSGSAAVIRHPTTIDERIAELERVTEQLRIELEARHRTAIARIDEVKQELCTSIASNRLEIHELSKKVEAATIGGFKQQAFGVMLAIWGASTSVFA